MNCKHISMLKSYLKVAAAVFLSLFLADGGDIFAVSWGDLRTYVSAAVASVVPLVITALDPNDTRWGRNTNG